MNSDVLLPRRARRHGLVGCERGRGARPVGRGPDAPHLPHREGAGCIAELPGASNREVADSAGVTDPGQISKLLRRLERLGLTVNTGGGRQSGEPNAWKLTLLGEEVSRRLSVLTLDRTEAA